MADNIIINAPTVPGGQIVASDDVGGVQHELVKVEFGTDGNATMVSTGNPLPVTDAVAEAALASIAGEDFATQATLLNIYNKLLASIAVTIASLPLPAGAAISANQQTDALTNTQLRLTPVPVSGTITVDTSLLATSAKQDTGNASLASILAKIIAAPSTEAKQDTIITALATLLTISDFDTKTGSLTETAPATDTASSGLNGRLQRIAQRLTSLIALFPTALGAGGGLKIDGSGTPLPVTGTLFNGAVTVADGADVTLGAIADVVVAAGAAGTISAKLRAISRDLVANVVLATGANIIGKVGIDQTTPGTTNGVQVNNTVTTTESSPSTIFNGKTNVTTSGTRVVLASSQVVKSVTIKALSTNTGLIYVGNSSVASTNGFQLSPGDTISMDLANLNTVNIDSAVNGEGVSYFAVA